VLESDAVQVATYTLLLQATYGEAAASFGYLRDQSGTVRIDLTPKRRRRVEEIVHAIRRDRRALVVHRSHAVAARCTACAIRAHCRERLA
jgi:CRISPR/Cas system-associated exonuclease Cas4 (RecB family)